MKGIILAGGMGSRLYPLTKAASKQMQPVYDKPMIYYPLTTLIECGIRAICVISTPQDLPAFRNLLGDGSHLGVRIDYREQLRPEGIAQAFLISESFIGDSSVALVLGDNIFSATEVFSKAVSDFTRGATIFAYRVREPSRYGVVEFDARGRAVAIREKPKIPCGDHAVPGLYLYDNEVIQIARRLRKSPRGELEISDVNQLYLKVNALQVIRLPHGVVWLDAGTTQSLYEASAYVQAIEERQGYKIGCPEEAALSRGFITRERLLEIVTRMPECSYRSYLEGVVAASNSR